jgi:hypothetical protein|tara:strand:- start:34440 stop:35024 length:585 start_codon:yes stop_codon:yes gene_type:complete
MAPGMVPGALESIKKAYGELGLASRLVSVFYSEIGQLNRVLVLHVSEDLARLAADQEKILAAKAPLGVDENLDAVSCELFKVFEGTDVLEQESASPLYEVRTYQLHSGGVEPTMAAWHKVIKQRKEVSPLTVVMHAVTGPTRFMHIWPYESFADRVEKRGKSVEIGIWPPPGGLPHIKSMQSELFLPVASPTEA